METIEMICIRCPVGCRLTASRSEGQVIIQGNECKRGEAYGIQEVLAPMRTVTSSVRVSGGVRPLVSVKTSKDVPKSSIAEVLKAIAGVHASAPVHIGDVIMRNVAGTGADLVATANLYLSNSER